MKKSSALEIKKPVQVTVKSDLLNSDRKIKKRFINYKTAKNYLENFDAKKCFRNSQNSLGTCLQDHIPKYLTKDNQDSIKMNTIQIKKNKKVLGRKALQKQKLEDSNRIKDIKRQQYSLEKWYLHDIVYRIFSDYIFYKGKYEKEWNEISTKNKIPRQCLCMRSIHTKGKNVQLFINKESKKASYRNVQTCRNVWTCPICGARITEFRKAEIEEACQKWLMGSVEHALYMLTLTIPHYFRQDCEEIVYRFCKSREKFKNQKVLKKDLGFMPYKIIEKEFGIKGEIFVKEVTRGDKNGWHLHSHALLFLDSKLTNEELASLKLRILKAWEKACKKAGVKIKKIAAFRKRSVDIVKATSAADYIAKFEKEGVAEPVEEYERNKEILGNKWKSADEMSKGHIKKANYKNMSPFDFLRMIRDNPGDNAIYLKYGRLFFEYAKAFEGKRQIVFSRGLKELLGMNEETEKTDEEIIEEAESKDEFYGDIPYKEWVTVLAYKLRGYVLNWSLDISYRDLMTLLNQNMKVFNDAKLMSSSELKELVKQFKYG